MDGADAGGRLSYRRGVYASPRSMPRALAVALGLLLGVLALVTLAPVARALPDGRAWELVSPPDKHGSLVEPLGLGIGAPSGGLTVASEEGNEVSYVTDGPVTSNPEGNRATEGNQVLARRGPNGWSAEDMVTPHEKGEGDPAGAPQEYRALSPDLSRAIVVPWAKAGETHQEPPLVPNTASEELGIYLRENASACATAPAPCYEPLVTAENDTAATPFGRQLVYSGSSPDLNHVVFESGVPLTPGASSEDLYEWNGRAQPLELVSRLPKKQRGGANAYEPQLGNDYLEERNSTRNAVSNDGLRIFWTGQVAEETKKALGEGRNLYMRSVRSDSTMEIESAEGKLLKEGAARFQTASVTGSRVFFTDTKKLTSDSLAKPEPANELTPQRSDLYVCEIEESNESDETCPKMTDLTGTEHGFSEEAGRGDVIGTVLGASEDGSTIYFVANGVDKAAAQAGASVGTCIAGVASEASCNLYVAHNDGSAWEEPKLVAVLSARDEPDWAGDGAYLTHLTARVSPNGRYVAFMSERPLTGYDNRDSNPVTHEPRVPEVRDEEVYLYDSSNGGSLACASCNPSGQRPSGVFDTIAGGEGQGLLVDPQSFVWPERWLAASIPAWTPIEVRQGPYQSRYLSDTGRLYFNSADSLVPEDVNRRAETVPGEGAAEVGVEDVYQYEPEGQGNCPSGATACVALLSSGTAEHESALLDASKSGNDVFFLTSAQLVPADIDSVYDIYDARVCSEGSPCIAPAATPAAPCQDEASCRTTTGGGAPAVGSVGSEAVLSTSSVPKGQTLPSKTVVAPKTKALTRAQKLKRALAACKKAHKHSKSKRLACERHARRTYGTKKKAKKK